MFNQKVSVGETQNSGSKTGPLQNKLKKKNCKNRTHKVYWSKSRKYEKLKKVRKIQNIGTKKMYKQHTQHNFLFLQCLLKRFNMMIVKWK